MIPRIDRYLVKGFFLGVIPVLGVLLGVFGFIDLTEELEDVGTGSFRASDALLAVLYSLPSTAIELAPVAALLGTLVGIGAMANSQELTTIRAAGLSVWRIAFSLSCAVVLFILILSILQFLAVPRLEDQAAQLRALTAYSPSKTQFDNPRWIRSGAHFVRIGDVSRGRILHDLQIYRTGENGALIQLLLAKQARILDDGRWVLQDVSRNELNADASSETQLPELYWTSQLKSRELKNLVAPLEALAPDALYRHIKLLEANNLNTLRHRVLFWQKVALPVELLGMALIGLPFIIGSVRSVSTARRVSIGSGFGILVYFSEQLIGHAAVLFQLSPLVSAVAPDLLLAGLAIALISRADSRPRVALTRRIKTPIQDAAQ